MDKAPSYYGNYPLDAHDEWVDNLINNLVDQGTIKYYSGGDMAEYRKY